MPDRLPDLPTFANGGGLLLLMLLVVIIAGYLLHADAI